jgi:hypothetical protein
MLIKHYIMGPPIKYSAAQCQPAKPDFWWQSRKKSTGAGSWGCSCDDWRCDASALRRGWSGLGLGAAT